MDYERVREHIKAEYGTMSEFCRVTNRDRYEMQLLFANCKTRITEEIEKKLILIEHDIMNHRDKVQFTDDILRTKIKMSVRRYGGVDKFTADHPEFKKHYVYGVIRDAKRVTDKVKELIKVLKIN